MYRICWLILAAFDKDLQKRNKHRETLGWVCEIDKAIKEA